jgi:SAM-dependent methyltransferase
VASIRWPTVMDYPKGFLPDLRRLRQWPSLRDSLWRNPDLVQLTYSELFRVVQNCVGSQRSRILYVGPGLGHIALELARDGHDVAGIDIDEESVALASRAAEMDPFRDARGSLSYRVGEFPGDLHTDGLYDRVLFSRVLHHIQEPGAAVAKATEVLRPDGLVVCVEFAHDRLGAAGARWMARWRRRLSASGWWRGAPAGSLADEAHRVTAEWRADHEGEGLNPLRTMLEPLRASFALRRLVWHPYLFWDLAAEMDAPADREGAVARRMRGAEARLLRERRLDGVLFSTIGRFPIRSR